MLVSLPRNRLKPIILIVFFVYITNNNNVNSAADAKRKVYFFENEKFLTWNDAFDNCKNMSLSLFTVKTKNDFDFLKSVIKQRYDKLLPYWLGAYKVEGVYIWIGSGEKIKTFYWHEGEPNDNSGKEKCIHTWEDVFDWNDNDCERELAFICEGED